MGSSGDLLADRRLAYGQAALAEGDTDAAADLARQTLELAPAFAAAWFLLGEARAAQFRADESGPVASEHWRDAVAAYENAAECDPVDRLGARLRLAALGVGDPALAMPPAYVRALFDEYAVRFDRHLVRSLKYRGPALLLDAVRRACGRRLRDPVFGLALDLGCGTGLAGDVFRGSCRRLHGVDLSPAMVERARRKKLYDELAAGDLVAWLAGHPAASADLILAADVFVYLGDLDAVFRDAARVLARDGLFAFTVQSHDREGAWLGPDLRYAHGGRYLDGLAATHGLSTVLSEPVSTREDRGEPVPGRLLVLGR